MDLVETICVPSSFDQRGTFTKVLSKEVRRRLPRRIKEVFFTVSQPDVIRGLHCDLRREFQWKLVWCISGQIWDVTLDLRIKSSSFGQVFSQCLNGGDGIVLVIPPGVAHGFASIFKSASSIVGYATTSDFSQAHDGGVRWDTCGIDWPVANPIISDRDRSLPNFSDFVSPF